MAMISPRNTHISRRWIVQYLVDLCYRPSSAERKKIHKTGAALTTNV